MKRRLKPALDKGAVEGKSAAQLAAEGEAEVVEGAEAPVEGLNLAHAFLLAGSRAVIAATRPVEDNAAQALFADLYRGWDRVPDLAAQLQRA